MCIELWVAGVGNFVSFPTQAPSKVPRPEFPDEPVRVDHAVADRIHHWRGAAWQRDWLPVRGGAAALLPADVRRVDESGGVQSVRVSCQGGVVAQLQSVRRLVVGRLGRSRAHRRHHSRRRVR